MGADKYWYEVPDIELLFLLALGRRMHDWERTLFIPPGRFDRSQLESIALGQARGYVSRVAEFHARNPRIAQLIDGGYDLVVRPSATFVQRAFAAVLNRPPTDGEMSRWLEKSELNPIELASHLFRLPEFTVIYGVHPGPGGNGISERNILQYTVNQINHDIYTEYVAQRVEADPRRYEKLRRLNKREIRVAVNLFSLSGDGLSAIETLAMRYCKEVNVKVSAIDVHTIINNNEFIEADILITNNNDLYNEFSRQIDVFKSAAYVSVCWLWDNHHQFGMSFDVVQHFDLVFPAHSNGQTYLSAEAPLLALYSRARFFSGHKRIPASFSKSIPTSSARIGCMENSIRIRAGVVCATTFSKRCRLYIRRTKSR
jgi:hypothetical protein